MGEYNINSHIKKYIIKTTLITISSIFIFATNITLDMILFVEGKHLSMEFNELSKDVVRDEMINENSVEYDDYREKYKDLDAIDINSNLEKLVYLDYTQIRFIENKIYIDIEDSTGEELKKSIDYLRTSGFSSKIESLRFEGRIQYVTMEVNKNA